MEDKVSHFQFPNILSGASERRHGKGSLIGDWKWNWKKCMKIFFKNTLFASELFHNNLL